MSECTQCAVRDRLYLSPGQLRELNKVGIDILFGHPIDPERSGLIWSIMRQYGMEPPFKVAQDRRVEV